MQMPNNRRGAAKKVLLVVLAVAAIAAAAGAFYYYRHAGGAEHAHEKEGFYTCGMHPWIVSDKPGDCPVCGMKLTFVEKAPQGAAAAQGAASAAASGKKAEDDFFADLGGGTGDRKVLFYKNPMNPMITSAVPKKDEMGMDYIPVYADEAQAGASSGRGERKLLFYRNPMNPAITSPVPMKDEMGMDYVPTYSDEAGAGGGIAGMGTVTLSDEGIRAAGVRTEMAVPGGLQRTVRTVGRVVADETLTRTVTTKVEGYVERLHVNFTGQNVKKGQPILDFYAPELLSTQEEYLSAREALSRLSGDPALHESGDRLVESARRRLKLYDMPDAAIAALERTGKASRVVTLTAPVSGVVTAKEVFEGTKVEPGMALYTVSDLSRVWVEADLYESEAALARVGREARITLPSAPGETLKGKVSFVYPFLQPESRTLRVRFDLANPKLHLKPSMYANVEMEVENEQGVLVPDSAVIDTGTRQVAFVEKSPGVFEPRLLALGLRADGKALVKAGVFPGERVAVKANFLLDSESRLRALIEGMTSNTPQKTSGN